MGNRILINLMAPVSLTRLQAFPLTLFKSSARWESKPASKPGSYIRAEPPAALTFRTNPSRQHLTHSASLELRVSWRRTTLR